MTRRTSALAKLPLPVAIGIICLQGVAGIALTIVMIRLAWWVSTLVVPVSP